MIREAGCLENKSADSVARYNLPRADPGFLFPCSARNDCMITTAGSYQPHPNRNSMPLRADTDSGNLTDQRPHFWWI